MGIRLLYHRPPPCPIPDRPGARETSPSPRGIQQANTEGGISRENHPCSRHDSCAWGRGHPAVGSGAHSEHGRFLEPDFRPRHTGMRGAAGRGDHRLGRNVRMPPGANRGRRRPPSVRVSGSPPGTRPSTPPRPSRRDAGSSSEGPPNGPRTRFSAPLSRVWSMAWPSSLRPSSTVFFRRPQFVDARPASPRRIESVTSLPLAAFDRSRSMSLSRARGLPFPLVFLNLPFPFIHFTPKARRANSRRAN